jgi:hypothetical protein
VGSNPTLSAAKSARRKLMEVKNAAEASQIVREFLSKMGWSVMTSPVSAEKIGNAWSVKFLVGFKTMKFEVDATTGEILRYGSE